MIKKVGTPIKEKLRLIAMSLPFGAIQVLHKFFFLEIGPPPPHPPPRSANNVEPYTFVTLFSRKLDPPPHTRLRYVTLEWSLLELVFDSLFTSKPMSGLQMDPGSEICQGLFIHTYSIYCYTVAKHPHCVTGAAR